MITGDSQSELRLEIEKQDEEPFKVTYLKPLVANNHTNKQQTTTNTNSIYCNFVQFLLEYMYTGNTDFITTENVLRVLTLANRFGYTTRRSALLSRKEKNLS